MDIIFEMFGVMFALFFAFMIFVFVKIIKNSNKYKKEPKITSYAKVVDKRNHVFSERSHYYATFEFSTGDRIELRLPHNHAGLIVVGDEGDLTFQGDMLLHFGREQY